MRILIVDDDYVSRSQIKALMSKYGDCDSAPTGVIAMDLFEIAHREEMPYDLISLDVDMPGLGGHGVVMRIRDFEEGRSITRSGGKAVKILMVSALKDSDNVMSSFREGCEGYILKPVTPSKLAEAFVRFDLA
ncbi:MAG: response regulator [Spirochaetota bacterium]